jgi:hypothetical protein
MPSQPRARPARARQVAIIEVKEKGLELKTSVKAPMIDQTANRMRSIRGCRRNCRKELSPSGLS